MTVYAPFTDDQVNSLNAYQVAGVMHPFTCGNRSERSHVWRDGDGDLGLLMATPAGWTCPQCDYTQDWAHGFMADWSWRSWPRRGAGSR